MMSPMDGEHYDAMARDLADAKAEIERLREAVRVRGGCRMLSEGESCDCGLCTRDQEIERLGRCNQHISHTFSGIINQHLHDLVKQNAEIMRLRAFRDAVYAAITENAGAHAAYAYIWMNRWDEIKAAEKARMR